MDAFPPVVTVELTAADVSGSPLVNLKAKDFAVTSGASGVTPIQVALVRPQAQTMPVVVLFDKSGSTAGPPSEAAKQGLGLLLDHLQGITAVKAYSFGSTVSLVRDWTSDLATVKAGIAPVKAEGSTALLQALDAAIQSLSGHSSPKAIVMFTDGKDTIGGPPMADLIARCRQQQIAVSIVGLVTPDLDSGVLQTLADQTGGYFVMAAREAELASRFNEVANRLQQPRYRLAIPWSDDAKSLRLRVGGRNAVELPVAIPVAGTSGNRLR
jgi:tight adherence protein B